mgnify:CR=1 FL=1
MGTDWRDNNAKVEPIVEIYQGCRQSYEMPGATPISVRQQNPSSDIYQFMNGTVVPEMAALLGREPFDPGEAWAALRAALREDPDIILVGEMRDLETIRLALTAAETGHLVFGTLHTSSAAKTIDRVIDVFPAAEKTMVRSMLSESLRAVISQTLMKKIGGGRIAAWEIMIGTPAIRNLISEDKVAQMYSAIQTGQAAGMITLDQYLQDLLARGLISKQDARRRAANKETFQ